MKRAVLALGGWLLGCGAQAPPDTTSQKAAVNTGQRVEAGRVHATVPQEWAPAPKAASDALRAAALAGTGRSGEVVLLTPPQGHKAGELQLLDVRTTDPATFWGWTVRDAAAAYRDTFRANPQWAEVTVTEGARAIDVLARGPTASSWVRLWALEGGSMVQLSCGCSAQGCEMFDACRLSDPPAEALPVTTPIVDERDPLHLALELGPVRVDAPPDFVRAESSAVVEASVAMLLYESPRAPGRDGLVVLDYSQCVLGPGCTLDWMQEEMGRIPGATVSREQRGQLDVRRIQYVHEGVTRQRVLWSEGGNLHVASCDCAGEACPLAIRTCRAGPVPVP